MEKVLNISEFKAKALSYLEDTRSKGKTYVITKKGIPIAQVIPISTGHKLFADSLKGLVEIQGDIVHFDTSADWEVLK